MRKVVLLLVTFTASITAVAQDFVTPDYAEIEKSVADPSSIYFYPGLKARFESFDSTLTLQDYRHFYLGYFFQPDYQLRAPGNDTLDGFRRKNELSADERKIFIPMARRHLKAYPFDFSIGGLLIETLNQVGEKAEAKREVERGTHLLRAILSTGDGKTCETGFHVVSISNEYFVMSVLGMRTTSQALINDPHHTCDLLSDGGTGADKKQLYFEITKFFEKETAGFGGSTKPEKKKKKKR